MERLENKGLRRREREEIEAGENLRRINKAYERRERCRGESRWEDEERLKAVQKEGRDTDNSVNESEDEKLRPRADARGKVNTLVTFDPEVYMRRDYARPNAEILNMVRDIVTPLTLT